MQYSLGKVSIRPRGAYSSSTAYSPLDAVSNLGGMFLCTANATGVEPGVTSGWASYWMVLANGIKQIAVTSTTTDTATVTATLSNGTQDSMVINVTQAALPLKFTNVTVTTSQWTSDDTYSEYPYKATIPLTSGGYSPNTNSYPQVTFTVEQANSGKYAPVAATYNGGVYIYASSQPTATITIPTIVCFRWSYDGST